MIFPRFLKASRLWCVLAACVCFGFSVDTAAAQSATVTQATPKKTTTKKTITRKSTTSRTSKATSTSARRTRARQRAAVIARTLREAQEPRFRLDESGALVPDVRAEAAIIYNSATGEVLWESNSQDQRSIASITKVMTAVVFLEDSPDLSEEVVVEASDVRAASTTYIRKGYRVTKGDLLHLTLIASDNAAARALARVSSRGSEAFIDRMNSKAAELGLTSTSYADPSGLLSANVSSAYDMAKLITYVSGDERIAEHHAEAELHRHVRPAGDQHPLDQSARHERRRRRSGREDRLHPQVRLLSGHAAAASAGRSSGCRRGPGRQVECRALLGNTASVQLVREQGRRSDRHSAPGSNSDR